MSWSDEPPTFEGYSDTALGERHQQVATDAVEDLLGKMIESWNADNLGFAEAAAGDLRRPILDLIAAQHARLVSEARAFAQRMAEFFPEEP